MGNSSEEMITTTVEPKPTLSRRAALRRFGEFGLVATAGVGLLELAGIRGATAQTYGKTATGMRPDLSCPSGYCPVYLYPGNCDGPCPSGSWCYEVTLCGEPGYACLPYHGNSYCRKEG